MPTSYRQIDLLTACRAVHSACDTKDPQGNTEQLRSIHSAKPAGAGSGAASTRLLTGNWFRWPSCRDPTPTAWTSDQRGPAGRFRRHAGRPTDLEALVATQHASITAAHAGHDLGCMDMPAAAITGNLRPLGRPLGSGGASVRQAVQRCARGVQEDATGWCCPISTASSISWASVKVPERTRRVASVAALSCSSVTDRKQLRPVIGDGTTVMGYLCPHTALPARSLQPRRLPRRFTATRPARD